MAYYSFKNILDLCLQNKAISNLKQTWSCWIKQVKKLLLGILTECDYNLFGNIQFDFTSLRSLKGIKNEWVVNTIVKIIPNNQTSNIRITTFHQAKGETFDAVLVVSAINQRKGGHWKEWLKNKNHENTRFAYVASSGPKYLLAWAIPKISEEDKNKITAMGFTLQNIKK